MFPTHERARAMAAFGGIIGVAGARAGTRRGAAGPNLFGWGWRSIFYINVPIGLGRGVAGRALAAGTRSRSAETRSLTRSARSGSPARSSWSRSR